MRKHRLWSSAPLLVAVLSACRQAPQPPRVVTPVRVLPAQPAPAASAIRYSATLQPITQVSVSFKVGGYVESILKVSGPGGTPHVLQEGDRVKKGTVLAVIRQNDYQVQVAAAKAQLASAQPALDKANRDMERAKKLYPEAMTRPDYDATVQELKTAQAGVRAAQEQIAAAQIPLSDTSLRAPLDGVVLSRKIELGTFVQPGAVAFIISSSGAMKAEFSVPEDVMRTLRLGQMIPVVFQSDIPEPTRQGSITAISPAADASTRVFEVEVTLPNPRADLQLGTIAAVLIGGDQPGADALAVPLSAVVRGAAGTKEYAVFVVEGEGDHAIARRRTVTLGPR